MPLAPFAGAQELKALAIQELDDILWRNGDDLAVELLGQAVPQVRSDRVLSKRSSCGRAVG